MNPIHGLSPGVVAAPRRRSVCPTTKFPPTRELLDHSSATVSPRKQHGRRLNLPRPVPPPNLYLDGSSTDSSKGERFASKPLHRNSTGLTAGPCSRAAFLFT